MPRYMIILTNVLRLWGWEVLQHPPYSTNPFFHVHFVRNNKTIKPRFEGRTLRLPSASCSCAHTPSDGNIYNYMLRTFKPHFSRYHTHVGVTVRSDPTAHAQVVVARNTNLILIPLIVRQSDVVALTIL
jgi:hypothetical protein